MYLCTKLVALENWHHDICIGLLLAVDTFEKETVSRGGSGIKQYRNQNFNSISALLGIHSSRADQMETSAAF
jgi:hypothetical protein